MDQTITFGQVADLYDEYVRSEIDLPFFVEEARQAGGAVLELMCGTGRVSIPLVRAGVSLSCVDYSPEMLARLEEKLQREGLSADVRLMDVRELHLDRPFSLILLPFNSFSELLTPEEQLQVLVRVRAHLAEGGRFICTLHNPGIRLRKVDGQLRLWGRYPRESGTLLLWGSENFDARSSVVSGVELFEEYDESGLLLRKRMLALRFRIVERVAFERLARSAGLEVDSLYGDYRRAPFTDEESPFMIWILRAARTSDPGE